MGAIGVRLNGKSPEDHVRSEIGRSLVALATGADGNIYCAVRADCDPAVSGMYRKGDVMALVVTVSKHDGYTYFKYIDEFMGPFADEMPAEVFDLLTPLADSEHTMVGYAKSWRARVQEHLMHA